MLRNVDISAESRSFAAAKSKYFESILDADRNTRSAPKILEACICMEDLSLSPKNPTLEIDVTAKTIDKNNINKSPLKTSDQNFFKPYKRPLITIIVLLIVHKLHHIFLLKIDHESLELRLFG